jgi:hypothetical protein
VVAFAASAIEVVEVNGPIAQFKILAGMLPVISDFKSAGRFEYEVKYVDTAL